MADVVELPVEQDDEAPARKLGPVTTATLRDLVEADRVETTLGQLCLTLARRIDEPRMDNGSQVATLAQKLADMLTAATRGTAKKTAPQALRDEVAERRAKHGA